MDITVKMTAEEFEEYRALQKQKLEVLRLQSRLNEIGAQIRRAIGPKSPFYSDKPSFKILDQYEAETLWECYGDGVYKTEVEDET